MHLDGGKRKRRNNKTTSKYRNRNRNNRNKNKNYQTFDNGGNDRHHSMRSPNVGKGFEQAMGQALEKAIRTNKQSNKRGNENGSLLEKDSTFRDGGYSRARPYNLLLISRRTLYSIYAVTYVSLIFAIIWAFLASTFTTLNNEGTPNVVYNASNFIVTPNKTNSSHHSSNHTQSDYGYNYNDFQTFKFYDKDFVDKNEYENKQFYDFDSINNVDDYYYDNYMDEMFLKSSGYV